MRTKTSGRLSPRSLLNRALARFSTLLIFFGVALLLVGGVVQGGRMWRVQRAARQAPPPDYAQSIAALAPDADASDAGASDPIAPDGAATAAAGLASTPTPEPGPPAATLDPVSATVAAVRTQRADATAGAFAPTVTPVPTARPTFVGPAPERIVIPALSLDRKVTEIGWTQELVDNDTLRNVWQTADFAAGFHRGSAPIGVPGNTVISAHNNIDGAIFARLHELEPGQRVYLFSGDEGREYEVWTNFVVQEEGVSYEQRLENGKWIGPSPDERLTLVTCWPPWGNSHRTIVIARPVGPADAANEDVPDVE
jgi:sortase A